MSGSTAKAIVFDNIRQKMLEFPQQASFKLERVTDAEFSNNQQQQQPQQQVKNQDTVVSEKQKKPMIGTTGMMMKIPMNQ